MGAYLGAYLGNELDDATGKKSSRLHLYPNNLKILRYSKTIKKPEIKTVDYNKSLKVIAKKGYKEISKKSITITFKTIKGETGEINKTEKLFSWQTFKK